MQPPTSPATRGSDDVDIAPHPRPSAVDAEAANPDLPTDHSGTACGRLLPVLCGAAEKLAKLSLCTLELASPRRITAKTKALVEQSKQFGDVVRSVVVFATLAHKSIPLNVEANL